MHFAFRAFDRRTKCRTTEGEKEQRRRRSTSAEEEEEQNGVPPAGRRGRREVALDPQHVLRRLRHRRLGQRPQSPLEGRGAARGNLQIRQ